VSNTHPTYNLQTIELGTWFQNLGQSGIFSIGIVPRVVNFLVSELIAWPMSRAVSSGSSIPDCSML
jgi:hypothetical protein